MPIPPRANANRFTSCVGLAALVFVLGGLGAGPGVAAVLTVGSGLGCDYATLAAALEDAEPLDELELEGGATYTATIGGSLEIRGGYTSACDHTRTESMTTVNAPADGRIVSLGEANVLELSQLRLEGARAFGRSPLGRSGLGRSGLGRSSFGSSGRGVPGLPTSGAAIWTRGAHLLLERVQVVDNQSLEGGAVAAEESFLTIRDSWFFNNHATDGMGLGGGAILCTGGGTLQLEGATFESNTSADRGGAILARDCDVRIYHGDPGTGLSGDGTNVWMANEADTDGGAIAAHGTSRVTSTAAAGLHLFSANTAEIFGGGVWVSGTEAELSLDGVRFENNGATNGGAVYGELALVELGRTGFGCRFVVGPCVEMFSNSALSGGAIHTTESPAYLGRILARGNTASLQGGVAFLYAIGSSVTTLSSSVVADTPESVSGPVIRFSNAGAGRLAIDGSTLTGHRNGDEIISVSDGSRLDLRNSIEWDNSGDLISGSPSGSSVIACNVVSDGSALPAGHVETLVADPRFQGVGDERLAADSPAIDLCDSPSGSGGDDLHLWDRPMGTAFDAGAHEWGGVFRSGSFEDGGVDRWSKSVP